MPRKGIYSTRLVIVFMSALLIVLASSWHEFAGNTAGGNHYAHVASGDGVVLGTALMRASGLDDQQGGSASTVHGS